jgi:PAS domain S-box-containing protein
VYSLSFANNSLETDLASDDTFPLLDDLMMRQLLHSYSTHSLPSSTTAKEMRNKLPPHLNLSNLEPFELNAKDSLPGLESETHNVTPSGYGQPLPKTVHDIYSSRLDSDPRAMVVTDIKSPFRITQVNTAWESLCGYKREECKGKSLGPLLQGPDTDWMAVSALLSNLFAGEEASVVLTNYAKSGRRFRNLVRVGPVKDEMGKTVNFVGVLRELKESDKDVSQEYDELRRETSKLPFVA